MKVGGKGLHQRGDGRLSRLQMGRQAKSDERARGDRPNGGAHCSGGQAEARGRQQGDEVANGGGAGKGDRVGIVRWVRCV